MLSSVFANSGSLRRALVGLAVVSALGAPQFVSAQTETFERPSLGYTGCQANGGPAIGTLDGDKEWVGFNSLDLKDYMVTCGFGTNNGYGQLTSSVGNIVALGAGNAYVHSVNPFVLNSMVAGAGWQESTSLLLEFYLGGQLKSSQSIVLHTNTTGLASYTGFYTGATDFIWFKPTYPADDASHTSDVFNSRQFCQAQNAVCPNGRYESWFVDNLDFSAAVLPPVVTPEPTTVALMGVGLLALGVAGRRRRKA